MRQPDAGFCLPCFPAKASFSFITSFVNDEGAELPFNKSTNVVYKKQNLPILLDVYPSISGKYALYQAGHLIDVDMTVLESTVFT